MKSTFTRTMLAMLTLGLASGANAGVQPPHTLKVTTNYDNVALSWLSPTADKELKWHSGRDYNGDTCPGGDPQKPVFTWVASMFTADDLIDNIGDVVEAISVFHYRPVVSAKAMVYCDDVVVAQGDCNMANYKKNTWERVTLDKKVTIEAGHEYKFVVRYEAGSNVDFVAIKDEAANAVGRGDLMSTDGKTWVATGAGEYLITAHLANTADTEAASYNVLVDGDIKATVTDTEYTVENISGTHTYAVEAVSADGSKASTVARTISTATYDSYLPAPNITGKSVSYFDVSLNLRAPLTGGKTLTWSEGEQSNAIGGTASSNTKVWVRNMFSASDLHAYGPDAKITAINMYFAESVMSGVTLWIMKDGALVYSQPLEAFEVNTIIAKEWNKFKLTTPFALEPGHDYAYGLYVLHTAKKHPISVDSSTAVNVKGNSFSTSACNSKDFLLSNPSRKTLASGGIPGNWMLSADIEGGQTLTDAITYDVTRDGETIATATTDMTIKDTVTGPGHYTYCVTSHAGDRTSMAAVTEVNVALPSAYSAPLLENASFDKDTKEFELSWSMDKELSHYGEATYVVGFEEDMSMMWGSQFSANELQAYKGSTINQLKIAIGDEVTDLSVGVYTAKGEPLSVVNIPDGTLEPVSFYTVRLDTPVTIDGTQDLVLAYSGTIPANKSSIILDAGPLVTGGARVSFTGGKTWNNLGTINATYNNYNIVISAIASPSETDETITKVAPLGILSRQAAVKADLVWGIDTQAPVKAQAKAPAVPKAKSFNVYHNGEVIANTTGKSFTEKVSRFGKHTYYVTALYENNWESPASPEVSFENTIAQKGVAPFGLQGTILDEAVKLDWQSPANSTHLSYITNNQRSGIGMTSSSKSITSYVFIRFSAETMAQHLGKLIDHISFGLYETVNNITDAGILVSKGENIVYKQSVPVKSLVVGDNDARLNEPVAIESGLEMGVGYYVTYAPGTHVLGTDLGNAVPNYGDLISSSATPGYWYSLKNKYKQDANWWITAILKTADAQSEIKTQADEDITYNVYCDGQLLTSGLTTPTYTVNKPLPGKEFYVTAVTAQGESGESNKFIAITDAITDITADEAAGDTSARYYNLQGIEMNREALTPGLYIRKSDSATSKVFIK